jgi:hypothetical protein
MIGSHHKSPTLMATAQLMTHSPFGVEDGWNRKMTTTRASVPSMSSLTSFLQRSLNDPQFYTLSDNSRALSNPLRRMTLLMRNRERSCTRDVSSHILAQCILVIATSGLILASCQVLFRFVEPIRRSRGAGNQSKEPRYVDDAHHGT